MHKKLNKRFNSFMYVVLMSYVVVRLALVTISLISYRVLFGVYYLFIFILTGQDTYGLFRIVSCGLI